MRSFQLAGLAILAGLSSASAQRSTITRDAFRSRADSLVFTYLAESHAPSASFAVIRGSDTLAYGAHGLANMDAWRAPTANTIYEIGSITKQFTSAAIMKLVEQGRVKLDDDLSKYVPQFPLQGKKVSIRQLLNHTSGIHSYTSSPGWAKTWNDELSPDAIIKFVAADTFDFAPGTAYRYNNTGYVLLGMVVEKASGQKYATYLDAQFFKPLGLRQTSYCPSKMSDPAFALGYAKGPSGPVRAQFLHLSHPFSAGALCSTVGDFAKWQRALDGGLVVSPASYTLMSTADSLNSGRKIGYGFGLVPGVFNGHKTISHTGGINGFATAATYVPDDSLSIVVFTNFDGASPQTLVQNLLRVAYGEAPVGRGAAVTQAAAPSLSAADRDAIVGNYTLQLPGGQALPIKFFLDGTRLMAQAQGQDANEMRYLGNYTFGVAFDPALRFTFTVDAGKATKVVLLQGGVTIDGPRVP
ncbi:MAG TPA: serine hydrolase domain-containing protein [Gemmatimonadaceae bacterium]|nr:serine hydrolase domain-containing protein [Gemmatimonadaceae bacterium]